MESDRFERDLRAALHRAVDEVPLTVTADDVRRRLAAPVPGRWSLALAALPTAVVVALAVVLIQLFGPPPTSTGPSVTAPASPSPRPTAAPTADPTPHPAARHSFAWAVGGGKLYLFGGIAGGESVASAAVFESFEWHALPSMPAPRVDAAAVATADGRIFVIGGRGGDGALAADVFVLDLRSETWSEATPLPAPISFAAAASVSDQIFVFGGDDPDDSGQPPAVQAFDLESPAWSTRQPMPTPLERSAIAVVDDGIYLFGGKVPGEADDTTVAYRYWPADDRWEQLPDLPLAGHGMSATVVDGRIWVIGAARPEDSRYTAPQVFDPATGSWTVPEWDPERRGPPNLTSRGHAALLLPSGQIMVIGGWMEPTMTLLIDTHLP